MNFIYFGERGLLMRQTAESKARELLASDKLEIHPDFLLIEPDENGTLSIDRIEDIEDFINMEVARAEKKVVLIDRIDVAVVAFQNAMLKFLEDNSVHVDFILTAESRLLDTVMSRCVTHQLKRASKEDMLRYIEEQNLPKDAHALAVASGRPKVYSYLVQDENAFLREIKAFTEAFGKLGSDARILFQQLGLVKEKNGSFFDTHSKEEVLLFVEYVQNLFCSILFHEIGAGECSIPQEVLSYEQLRDVFSVNCLIVIYERCMEDQRKLNKKGQYTKNDFFDFFRFVYGLIGKE